MSKNLNVIGMCFEKRGHLGGLAFLRFTDNPTSAHSIVQPEDKKPPSGP